MRILGIVIAGLSVTAMKMLFVMAAVGVMLDLGKDEDKAVVEDNFFFFFLAGESRSIGRREGRLCPELPWGADM